MHVPPNHHSPGYRGADWTDAGDAAFCHHARLGSAAVASRRYDPATRELRYVNGGHHPALLRHPDGSIEELDSDGMPFGLLPDPPYQEGIVVLEPGAPVLIFSDGVQARAQGDACGRPRARPRTALGAVRR